jgi:choline dehydrogenase-like flavoprotein
MTPDTPRPTDETVDVLIIGAGASGAAVAWSLAETRMKILCLEQGDWIKPTDIPISTSAPTAAAATPTIRSTIVTRS